MKKICQSDESGFGPIESAPLFLTVLKYQSESRFREISALYNNHIIRRVNIFNIAVTLKNE